MGQQYKNQSRDCAIQNRFTGYLQVALRRRKRDYIQKQVQEMAHEYLIGSRAAELTGDPDCGFGGSSQDLWQLEDTALAQALSTLTARERFILLERVLNGSGYNELGKALGLRYNGVASAYHSIIKKLRKELRGEGK